MVDKEMDKESIKEFFNKLQEEVNKKWDSKINSAKVKWNRKIDMLWDDYHIAYDSVSEYYDDKYGGNYRTRELKALKNAEDAANVELNFLYENEKYEKSRINQMMLELMFMFSG